MPPIYAGRSHGFSLIEVLIGLLILVIGFLGVAGMQTISVYHNHAAYLRSQAVVQAHDMAERIYNNRTVGYGSLSGSNTGCLTDSSNPITVNCTPTQMAQFDIYEWNATNARVLPSGTGTISASGGVETITLSWTEQEDTGAATKSFNFQVKRLR